MAQEQPSVSQRRTVIAGMAGNILEWYDFSIYGFFALAIGENFFPSHNASTSLIDAFGAFAAGFLMRPVGALLFGYIGDRHGRGKALTLSVLAMAGPTFLIGVLPTYRQIGVIAPVLVVLLRLLQGLSVGGEYTTSVVFMVERAPSKRRGLTGAFGASGTFFGVMVGSAVGTLVAWFLPTAALLAWGWRLPFLFGISIGVAGYFLRRDLATAEPPARPAKQPLADIWRSQWRRVLQISGLKLLSAVGFYLMFVYSTTYLAEVVGIEKGWAMAFNTIGMAAAVLVLPLAGALSDRVGRKPVMTIAAIAMIIFTWPLFQLLWHPDFHVPLIGQLGFALIIAMYEGVSPSASVEAFPSSVRCSGLAISHNLVMALFGGTAPLIAAFMIERTNYKMAPSAYLIAAAAISLLIVFTLKETARVPLSVLDEEAESAGEEVAVEA
ncbi:MAG: MFS transporter [Candidatus Binataceae bacterium]